MKGGIAQQYPKICCPAHTWVASHDAISTETCMESGTSVLGQFPANARCLHQEDGPTQRILFWPLSGESKLYLSDVDMSRSL